MAAITPQALRDYLLDDLPDTEEATVERALRADPALGRLLEEVRDQLDRGDHSLGAIWRRERITCPTRDQLGAHLLGATDPDFGDYIDFHLGTIGCPLCRANRDDLAALQAEPVAAADVRQRRIVRSSAGLFRR